jgi:hypothetical protein
VKVAAALVAAGKTVLTPLANVKRYDLVIEEQGVFSRVQCKTGRLFRGAVFFRTHRLRAAKREAGWERKVTTYVGDVDFFGVYCPDNDTVYLVPITVTSERNCSLRVAAAQNGQHKGIRWARDFLVKPLMKQVEK